MLVHIFRQTKDLPPAHGSWQSLQDSQGFVSYSRRLLLSVASFFFLFFKLRTWGHVDCNFLIETCWEELLKGDGDKQLLVKEVNRQNFVLFGVLGLLRTFWITRALLSSLSLPTTERWWLHLALLPWLWRVTKFHPSSSSSILSETSIKVSVSVRGPLDSMEPPYAPNFQTEL